jgi:hypothetical protein
VKKEDASGSETKPPTESRDGTMSPSRMVVQAGAAVSFGQQGGITAAQVIINDDSLIPTRIQYSSVSTAAPRPSLFPHALQVTLASNKRFDSPNFALLFDGPVEIPTIPFSGMNQGTGRVNDTNGPNDPNSVWIFWGSPSLIPEKPAVITIESLKEVHLLSVSKGPKTPF